MLKGHLHSIESMGTVDGPGIRYILFTQGCLLRCLYCHNPDTWQINSPYREVTVDEMVNEIITYKPYFDASQGGVTVSGGEPLLQMPFLTALFKELQSQGIHTCIDTSAGCANDSIAFNRHFEELLQYTDLLLLDIKHMDDEQHVSLTGKSNKHILKVARKLSDMQQPVWIRHVLVPGYTDSEKALVQLGEFINSLKNVERFEILPYHQLGVHKWKALNIPYRLNEVAPPSDSKVRAAYRAVNFKGKIPIDL
ncbi:pyruvate formate-lyase-activating protein [Staphylococcus edaphicus]|uniref:Pyruvate formate-lyase-activating enzyme n=1 Tax=Staphylococcus edaphicus TaxID=1955013 RepID=A0A2C6WRW2_9STAP|nr:pyruvate formate-lyase-activating protein [Staphylococcus edaphicus]PHK50825.1 pyruvate formate-lyase 1-activating enzyme [Staphylococcus edaphicus]UQW82520.1 pyruvate formate-lyase-activating protein [Staphylococcus edaphicus]